MFGGQAAGHARSTPALISPEGRRVMLGCAFLAALITGSIGLWQDTFNPMIAIIMGLLGIALTWFAVSPFRRYYTPAVFSIWFNLGFLLSFGELLVNEVAHRSHPNPATGGFAYTDAEMWAAVGWMIPGIAAIVVATMICERFSAGSDRARAYVFISDAALLRAMAIWTIVGVSIALLLILLQIGRTGLVNKTDLPFRLGGVLSFSRGYLIPAFGVMLIDLAINSRKEGALKYIFACLLIVGFVGSVSALSRGYLAFLVIAVTLYLTANLGRHRFGIRSVAVWIVVGLPLLLLGVSIVNALREGGFSGRQLDITSTYAYVRDTRFSDAGAVLFDVFNLALGRIGGLQEMLGTLSVPHAWHIANPWGIFLDDGVTALWLQKAVLGYEMVSNDIVGFGYSFGLFGTLSLSGAPLIVLIGTALYLIVLMLLEEAFLRIGSPAVALSLAVNVGFQFWGFAHVNLCANLAGIVLIIFLLNRLFFRSSSWVRPKSAQ